MNALYIADEYEKFPLAEDLEEVRILIEEIKLSTV